MDPQLKMPDNLELINPTALDDRTYSATQMLEKRREMFEVEQALESQKAQFARKLTEFKRKEEELHTKDQELQESLVRFNKFLHDNDHKCVRAQKKVDEERDLTKQKVAEINDLKDELASLRADSAKHVEDLAKMRRYTDFLEGVLDHDEEFTEIKDILTRYETLMATNTDLTTRSGEIQGDIEEARANLGELAKLRAGELLALNNQLSVLQQKVESCERTRSTEQAADDLAAERRILHSAQVGALRMAGENMFSRALATSHVLQRPSDMPATPVERFKLYLQTAVNHYRDLEFVLGQNEKPAGKG